jgi:hypothetical protein
MYICDIKTIARLFDAHQRTTILDNYLLVFNVCKLEEFLMFKGREFQNFEPEYDRDFLENSIYKIYHLKSNPLRAKISLKKLPIRSKKSL